MRSCQQCGRPATVRITHQDEEGELYLCVDCDLKREYAESLEFQRTVQQLNMAAAAFEATTGLTGLVPRMPIPPTPQLRVGNMNVNNINVDNSVIGVLNTGSIKAVDSAVTVLKRSGADGVASAIANFTEQVVNSNEADNDTKNRVVEILSVVAEEATKPNNERRVAVIRPLLVEISSAVSGIAALTQLWHEYGPIIVSFFN